MCVFVFVSVWVFVCVCGISLMLSTNIEQSAMNKGLKGLFMQELGGGNNMGAFN